MTRRSVFCTRLRPSSSATHVAWFSSSRRCSACSKYPFFASFHFDPQRGAPFASFAAPTRRRARQVPQQPSGRAGLHRRGVARPGHSAGGSGGELRSACGAERLRASRGTNGASGPRRDGDVAADAAERGEAAENRGEDGEAMPGVRWDRGGSGAEDLEPSGEIAARGEAVYGGEWTGSEAGREKREEARTKGRTRKEGERKE